MKREQVSLLFGYVCFSKFGFIHFVRIHTWKRGWRKMEVSTDQGNDIQTKDRDMFLSQRLAILTLQFELCMRTIEIDTCLSFRNLTVVSSFECQNDTLFSLSLYSIFLSISQEKLSCLPNIKVLQNFLFSSFSNTLQIVNLQERTRSLSLVWMSLPRSILTYLFLHPLFHVCIPTKGMKLNLLKHT